MPQLNSLTVRGYRSINELNELPLTNLNVLTGVNGVGKSNFLSLFRMLRALERRELQNFVSDEGGADAILFYGSGTTSRISASFDFGDIGYRFELFPTDDDRLVFASEHSELLDVYSSVQPQLLLGTLHDESNLRVSTDNYSPVVRRALSQLRVCHFRDLRDISKDKRPFAGSDRIVLEEDASNLGPVLQALSAGHAAEYGQIVETIRRVAPFFDDFVFEEGEAGQISLKWSGSGGPAGVQDSGMLSFGLLRFICFITTLFIPDELKAPITILDEPELGLHPALVRELADILGRVSRSTQLIVSTLSPELVNAFGSGKIIAVDLVDGASVFRRL